MNVLSWKKCYSEWTEIMLKVSIEITCKSSIENRNAFSKKRSLFITDETVERQGLVALSSCVCHSWQQTCFGGTPSSPAHFPSCGAPPSLRHGLSQWNCPYLSFTAFEDVRQVELEDKPSHFQMMTSLWALGCFLFQGARWYLDSSQTPSALTGESQASSESPDLVVHSWLRFRAPRGAFVKSSRARSVPPLFIMGETERSVNWLVHGLSQLGAMKNRSVRWRWHYSWTPGELFFEQLF